MIQVGDYVTPKTKAGLWLSSVPCDGDRHQKRDHLCVFKNIGKVIDVKDTVINYDSWDDDYHGIGKILCRNCLVQSPSGTGWGCQGALVKKETE